MRNSLVASLLLMSVSSALAAPPAAPAHEAYICASINKGYVIGSTIVTTNGLFRRNAAGEWEHFGQNDTTIRGVAFDPRDHNIIYTNANNGCWRSLDGGRNWRITTSWDMTEPLDVEVDPNSPATIYLALPDGIAVSTDGAQTWSRREKGLPARGKYTQVVAIDPTRAGRVLAGCESGIYLTENAGGSWKRVLPTDTTVNDIVFSPHDPKKLIAVTQSNGAWLSSDAGATWKKIEGVSNKETLYNAAFDARDSKRIVIGGYMLGVLTSEDGGATWTSRNQGLPATHCVWRVAVDPDTGRLLASVVEEAIYVSDDFGRTWRNGGMDSSVVARFVFVPPAMK